MSYMVTLERSLFYELKGRFRKNARFRHQTLFSKNTLTNMTRGTQNFEKKQPGKWNMAQTTKRQIKSTTIEPMTVLDWVYLLDAGTQ